MGVAKEEIAITNEVLDFKSRVAALVSTEIREAEQHLCDELRRSSKRLRRRAHFTLFGSVMFPFVAAFLAVLGVYAAIFVIGELYLVRLEQERSRLYATASGLREEIEGLTTFRNELYSKTAGFTLSSDSKGGFWFAYRPYTLSSKTECHERENPRKEFPCLHFVPK